ncbi:MAG: class I SAM-dependent methyltransferase [Polyangiaceae bacterium]|nr:class I SAM-dependent methyltransferase [Polyangiaceae bacterium]
MAAGPVRAAGGRARRVVTMLELTPEIVRGVPKNGPTDPIEFYRRPLVGWLFRERINVGLRLLPRRRYARALEVGYGSGAVQLVLRDVVDELAGVDLDADPVEVGRELARRGCATELRRGDVCALPYGDGAFDLVVSFSVFEHLRDYRRALAEVARVLRPHGLFLLGMPSVNLAMEAGFRLIGFRGIADHHVTTPAAVKGAFRDAGLGLVRHAGLDLPVRRPFGLRLYHCFLLERAR